MVLEEGFATSFLSIRVATYAALDYLIERRLRVPHARVPVVERAPSPNPGKYAKSVTEGGSGNAFAGHGELRPRAGTTIVPEKTTLTVWGSHGTGITDDLGKLVENGDHAAITRLLDENPEMWTRIGGAQS